MCFFLGHAFIRAASQEADRLQDLLKEVSVLLQTDPWLRISRTARWQVDDHDGTCLGHLPGPSWAICLMNICWIVTEKSGMKSGWWLAPEVAVEDEQEREELLARRLGRKRSSNKDSKAIRYDEWGDEI